MEQLMAHAMASHNHPQHQFHPGNPFGQQNHVIGIPQQALMGNPNMGMPMHMNQHHPSVSLQIPDPHKMIKQEHNFSKMSQQPLLQNSFPPDCQYPMMPPTGLAQNLSVKKEKNSLSGGEPLIGDHWMTHGSSNISATGEGKPKKGKKNKQPGQKKKKKFMPVTPPPPPPPPIIPEKEKPFECITCGRRFTQRIGMLQHQRRHTGERPFGCNFCDKRFTQKSGLVQHERLHTNEKPFGCSYCEKAFTQKSGLVQHERTHTGEKPYVCLICAKAFTQLSGLKQHKKVHERSSDGSK